MAKRIRQEHTYLAPQILSWIDDHNNPIIYDERYDVPLIPTNIDDKIIIYERQVKEWFLNRALRIVNTDNYGFIVLMICLSYLEGIEQYRKGEGSNGNSTRFFRNSIHRIFPHTYYNESINMLYREARCGLFHNGMVEGKIVISNNYNAPIQFIDGPFVKINPKLLLEEIVNDFDSYIVELKNPASVLLRDNFNIMFSNL